MRDFPPTNERRSQGLLTHLRTVTTRALGGSTAKKYAPHTPPETHPVQNSPRAAGPGAHPVQNSPRTPTPAAQPVQNSPNTPKIAHFSPFCPSRENFVPHQQPNRYKTLPAQPVQALTRYKTLPTRPRQQPNRYKTLPTRPKRPISASFARAGRTLYRFHHHDPQQGELCTALTITMPSRENFVPLAPPRPPAGRTLSRTQRQTRYKTLPTRPRQQPNRYKTLPAHPKLPISARFARAGRTLYRSHHHAPQQGELCTAPSTKPGTKLSQHAPTSSPTGTKLSQHAQKGPFPRVLAKQGELYTASTPTTPSRENFVPHQAPNPVQNSPRMPQKAHFHAFWPSRENYVPLAPPRPPAGRTLYRSHHHDPQQGELCTALTTTTPAGRTFYRTQRQTRYKTLPAHPRQQPNRYKTLPTHPKRPISARFARAGRTLYRIHPHDPQQGELCTAPSTTPAQNSPRTPTPAAQPVQNSPNTPKNAHFSQFCPSRENFVPLSPSRCPAGRTLYRAQRQTRYKTLPAQPVRRPNRYKTLPTRPHQQPNRYKTLPAHPASSPTGTKLPQHAPSHIPAANKLAQHT